MALIEPGFFMIHGFLQDYQRRGVFPQHELVTNHKKWQKRKIYSKTQK
jgi:hypothetical protein